MINLLSETLFQRPLFWLEEKYLAILAKSQYKRYNIQNCGAHNNAREAVHEFSNRDIIL
jgi:hypothetical protein